MGTAEERTTDPGHEDVAFPGFEGDQTEADPVSKMQEALKLREESKGKVTAPNKESQLGAKPKSTCAMKRPASAKMVTAKAKAKCAMKVAPKGSAKKAGYILVQKGLSVTPLFFLERVPISHVGRQKDAEETGQAGEDDSLMRLFESLPPHEMPPNSKKKQDKHHLLVLFFFWNVNYSERCVRFIYMFLAV